MKILILIFGSMLFFDSGIFSQIQGRVEDRKGKGVPNTTVTAGLSGTVVATVESNDSAFYEFKGLKPGTYKIEAKAAGFRPAIYKKVVVHEGDTGAVDEADDLYQGILLDIILSTDMLPSQIEGIVIDLKEKGQPNITVIAKDASEKVIATAKSDPQGFYSFKSLRPGIYKIEAKAAGFRPAVYMIKVNDGESEEELVDINQGIWLYIVLKPTK